MMDVLGATLDALREAKLSPLDTSRIRTDGVLSRFDAEGDKAGKRNAWCVVFPGDRPVAVFGHWSKGIRETCVLGSAGPMTPVEREQQRNAMAQAQAARESALRHAQQKAKRVAQSQWSASTPAPTDHPYLIRKAITWAGARERNGCLLIPMRDQAGALWNVQSIRADGQKRFLRGGRVMGCYCPVGGRVEGHVVICEGWATGKSLHEATGLPVAVAFSAGNLDLVARIMREKYPTARITIAADNDVKPDGSNPGVAAATAAAQAVDGFLAIPPIAGDFNDYAAQRGPDAFLEVTQHVKP
jgi:putative DNA primase/helicase